MNAILTIASCLATVSRVSAKAGRRLVFGAAIAAAAGVCDAQQRDPLTMDQLADVARMVHSLQVLRDLCSHFYPAESSGIFRIFDASTIPAYAKLLDYERDFSGAFEGRNDALTAMQMDAETWSAICFTDFASSLNDFDADYGNRMDEVRELVAKLELELAAERAEAANPKPPAPPDPRIKTLVSQIEKASSDAYQVGDWSMFAGLYQEGTFACWADVDPSRSYAYLAIPPIPETATFTVTAFTEYFAPNGSFTRTRPTHLMEIGYELSTDGRRCGDTERKTWPRHHFFLVEREDRFELTHYCPSPETLEMGRIERHALSAARTAANLTALSASDWDDIPKAERADRPYKYAYLTVQRLTTEHDVRWEEANAMIDFVCDPAHAPPNP